MCSVCVFLHGTKRKQNHSSRKNKRTLDLSSVISDDKIGRCCSWQFPLFPSSALLGADTREQLPFSSLFHLPSTLGATSALHSASNRAGKRLISPTREFFQWMLSCSDWRSQEALMDIWSNSRAWKAYNMNHLAEQKNASHMSMAIAWMRGKMPLD